MDTSWPSQRPTGVHQEVRQQGVLPTAVCWWLTIGPRRPWRRLDHTWNEELSQVDMHHLTVTLGDKSRTSGTKSLRSMFHNATLEPTKSLELQTATFGTAKAVKKAHRSRNIWSFARKKLVWQLIWPKTEPVLGPRGLHGQDAEGFSCESMLFCNCDGSSRKSRSTE